MEVTKLGGTITSLTWECNGQVMESKIVNKRGFSRLIVEGATADMAGSCTCAVTGVGSQDSETIEVIARG